MRMEIKTKGKSIIAEIGVLTVLSDVEATFLVNNTETNISLSNDEYSHLKELLEDAEGESLLLPIDLTNKQVILDAEVPESSLDELLFDD